MQPSEVGFLTLLSNDAYALNRGFLLTMGLFSIPKARSECLDRMYKDSKKYLNNFLNNLFQSKLHISLLQDCNFKPGSSQWILVLLWRHALQPDNTVGQSQKGSLCAHKPENVSDISSYVYIEKIFSIRCSGGINIWVVRLSGQFKQLYQVLIAKALSKSCLRYSVQRSLVYQVFYSQISWMLFRGSSLFTRCLWVWAGSKWPSDPGGCPVLFQAGRSSLKQHTSCISGSSMCCSCSLHIFPKSSTHHLVLAEKKKEWTFRSCLIH